MNETGNEYSPDTSNPDVLKKNIPEKKKAKRDSHTVASSSLLRGLAAAAEKRVVEYVTTLQYKGKTKIQRSWRKLFTQVV